MEIGDSKTPLSRDYSASVPLEISSEVAGKADDLLREFAEDAGLETALIVDRSGALVAGISAEAEVTIDVISALVAGASGAMRALVAQLGETGAMESLHLGGDRMIYLREIINRFILVGVSNASRPAGLVRQKAQSIEQGLADLLKEVMPVERPAAEPADVPVVRSIGDVARRRAAEHLTPVSGEEVQAVSDDKGPEPVPEVPRVSAPKSAPREVLETLDSGELEIVIEKTRHSISRNLPVMAIPADSPFETERDDTIDEADDDWERPVRRLSPSESIFELEDFDEDEEETTGAIPGEPVKEIVKSAAPNKLAGTSRVDSSHPTPGDIFEIDELEEELEEDAENETEDLGAEIKEMIDSEDEESEVRSSGPFYF